MVTISFRLCDSRFRIKIAQDMQKDVRKAFEPIKTRIKYGGALTDSREFKAIQKVLNRNWWTLDEEGKFLEQELAKVAGVKYAVLTNSGSSALLVGISALNLPSDTPVLIPATCFPTAVSALIANQLVPVYVDSCLSNFCADLDEVEAMLKHNKNIKAFVLVLIAGNMPDMERVKKLGKKYNVKVVLDNCDGFGGAFKGKPVETYADLSCASFHAAHIIAMGEGGAVFTNDEAVAKRARSIREWGRASDDDQVVGHNDLPKDYPARYTYTTIGYNVKPLELQAAMGRVQLKKLAKFKKERNRIITRYLKGLKDFPTMIPETVKGADPCWFAFPLLSTLVQRGPLMKYLELNNIETRVIFAGNIVKQPAYKNIGVSASELEKSNLILERGFFVSAHPSLTNEMVDFVVKTIRDFIEANNPNVSNAKS